MDEILTVDQYIAQYPEEMQERLKALRTAIHEPVPDLTESMAWKMPTFKKQGSVIHFAVQTHHIGLYPGSEAVEAFAPKLTDYKTSKGGIQLPHTKPLPLALVKELAAYSAEENRRHAEAKAKK